MIPTNRRFSNILLAALFFSATCAGVLNPASAQGNRPAIGTQPIIDNEIPDLVRPGPVKTTPEADAAVRKKAEQRGIARARAVEIDFSVLETVNAGRAITSEPRVIRVAFFEDTALLAEITNIVPTSSGGLAFTGRVPGILHSTVVLVNNNGVVSMNVSALSRQYTIHGSADAGYVASELLKLDLPEHTSPPIEINAPPLPKPQFQTAADTLTAADTGAEIDVMVVYTPVVRVNSGGTAQMDANIDAQIVNTNLIYANSNVVQRLRLVYKGEVAYTEVSINTDLSRLQNPSDGFLDTVPMLRDIYKADFVSLWGNYPGTCGLGYLMTTESNGFESNAYNAVNSPDCTVGTSATFAHELGHNMGLQHDNFVTQSSPTTVVTPEGSTTPATIAYAHGYVDTVNRFRTVMAYDDQCIATAPGTPCDRIPNFSNPNVSFNTFTSGNLANAHARQALNDTRETTANFRTGLPASAFTGPGIVVFFPASYAVGDSAGSVQLTIQRHVGSTGAISVSFATANGTATAGRSFTATSGILTWAADDITARTITVPILPDVLKGREYFTVVLTNPVGGVSIGTLNGTTATATVAITSDKPDTFPVGGVIPPGYVTPASSAAAWTVDLTDGFQSPNSLKSAAVLGPSADNSVYANSDLEYSSTFTTGNVSFAYRVSSLGTSFANLEFMIDGVLAFSSAGGDTGWLTSSQAITAGVHTLRWRFKNRVNFPCAFATSPVPPPNCADRAWIDTVILPLTASTTALTSSRNPSTPGQAVTFTATVSGTAGTPQGTTTFKDGGAAIANCNLLTMTPGGSAQCSTTTLTAGTHSITADYSGNVTYNGSTSPTLSQIVNTQGATVPDAPTIGPATAGNAQAMITFTAPASNGGSVITGYTATCNPGTLTGTAVASPVDVTNLVNGTLYTCSVIASNAVGPSVASSTVTVTPSASAALALVGIVSRKTHTGAGAFDITVDTTPGAVTVEPRTIGSGHTIVFQFNNAITAAGSITAVDTTSATIGATAIASGSDVIVTIPSLADNKRITLTLAGVNGSVNPAPVSMGFLVGDVNNTRSVNSSDISSVKARSGQPSNSINFKFDVNASGSINSSDVSAVKARSGLVLP